METLPRCRVDKGIDMKSRSIRRHHRERIVKRVRQWWPDAEEVDAAKARDVVVLRAVLGRKINELLCRSEGILMRERNQPRTLRRGLGERDAYTFGILGIIDFE